MWRLHQPASWFQGLKTAGNKSSAIHNSSVFDSLWRLLCRLLLHAVPMDYGGVAESWKRVRDTRMLVINNGIARGYLSVSTHSSSHFPSFPTPSFYIGFQANMKFFLALFALFGSLFSAFAEEEISGGTYSPI